MKQERIITTFSGYLFLFVTLILIFGGIYGIISVNKIFIILLITGVFFIPGFFLVNPNTSKVILLFGKYIGTVKENGFYWANPFYTKKGISLRASNFDSERVKVNDKLGNPIMIDRNHGKFPIKSGILFIL